MHRACLRGSRANSHSVAAGALRRRGTAWVRRIGDDQRDRSDCSAGSVPAELRSPGAIVRSGRRDRLDCRERREGMSLVGFVRRGVAGHYVRGAGPGRWQHRIQSGAQSRPARADRLIAHRRRAGRGGAATRTVSLRSEPPGPHDCSGRSRATDSSPHAGTVRVVQLITSPLGERGSDLGPRQRQPQPYRRCQRRCRTCRCRRRGGRAVVADAGRGPGAASTAARTRATGASSARACTADAGSARARTADAGSARAYTTDPGSTRAHTADAGSTRARATDTGSTRARAADAGSARARATDTGSARARASSRGGAQRVRLRALRKV